MTKPTHYLRFVHAVVLAATVPACSASSENTKPDPSADPQKTEEPAQAQVASKDATESKEDAGAAADAADAGLPFSSGPLMPPVLPASFA